MNWVSQLDVVKNDDILDRAGGGYLTDASVAEYATYTIMKVYNMAVTRLKWSKVVW